MNEPTYRQAVDRWERVDEKKRFPRVERVGLVGLAALALVGQAMPSSPARVLEAERFVVRDSKGTIRGQFGLVEDAPRLLLYDETGRPRVRLVVQPDAVHLFITDDGDHTRIRLFANKDQARLLFADEAERERALIGLDADGKPSVVLRDERIDRTVLGHGQVKQAGIEEQRDASSLVFFDTDGKLSWKAP